MSKNTLASCGAVEMLNQLRRSQEAEEVIKSESQKPSRLEKYMAEGKKQVKTMPVLSESAVIEHPPTLSNNFTSDVIHEIDPYKIHRWSEKDRPENELGNIEDLSKSFKKLGQQVPCIVRPYKEKPDEFELIVGECRWHAAKLAQLPLKVIIHNLDDRMAALIQAAENEERSDLSEYAKGMSYADKIEKGMLSQTDLIDILGISRQQVSRLLSFRRIPQQLAEAIVDFRRVSARTAEELSRLSAKGEKYIDALVALAPKIRTGKFGGNSILKEVSKVINQEAVKSQYNKKVHYVDGRHLFTWRLDNNAVPSMHFPKDIVQLFNDQAISFDEITEAFKECLGKKLADLHDKE